MEYFSFLFQLLGLLIGLVITGYIYLKYVIYNYWKNRGVRQVDTVVPFGNMLPVVMAKKSAGEYFRDLYLKFENEPVYGFYSFHKPSLVIRNHDLIRFVLTKEFSAFQNRGLYSNVKIDPLSGNIFALAGKRWKELRSKFTPTFTSGKMKNMFLTIKECSDNLVECIAEEMKDNNDCLEFKDIIARFTTDVIASVAFGIECNSLKNQNAEFRSWGRKAMEGKPIANALMIFCPSLLKLFNISTTRKDVSDFIINTFKETVEYRTANDIVRKDFLDLVMQLINKGYLQNEQNNDQIPDDSEKITMLEGAAQAFIFWVAGFDSSSSAVTHCLYELAVNPKTQDKLIDEIDKVLKEFKGLTYESLQSMPYLQKVISETLRKYPSLPMLNRECNKDIDLPGTNIRVKNGTPIIIPVWGLHSDPKVFPDPDKFDPERFSEENIAKRHNYAYLPFGDGPRNCIGMRFGVLQSKMGLVSVLSNYRVEIGPDTPIPLCMDPANFLMGPKDGISLRVKVRKCGWKE